jgi:hypothetical protein
MQDLNINVIKDWIKKISVKDWFIIFLTVIVLAFVLTYLSSKKDVESDMSDIASTTLIATTSTSTTSTVKTKTTTPKVIPSTNVISRCNFKVTSPTMYSSVSMPFTVNGLIDKEDTTKGCMWNENLSRAGDAEIFYNRNGEGWKSAGTAVPIITRVVPGGATTTLSFTVSFNLYTKALGLTSGTPIKITFTELNIPVQNNLDFFEFQVKLK